MVIEDPPLEIRRPYDTDWPHKVSRFRELSSICQIATLNPSLTTQYLILKLEISPISDSSRYTRRLRLMYDLGANSWNLGFRDHLKGPTVIRRIQQSVVTSPSLSSPLLTFIDRLWKDLRRDTRRREPTKIRLVELTFVGIDTHMVESHSRYSGKSFNSLDCHQNPLGLERWPR